MQRQPTNAPRGSVLTARACATQLVNVARFAVPLRIGLALGTTPWVDENLVQPFLGGDKDGDGGGDDGSAPEEAAKTAA